MKRFKLWTILLLLAFVPTLLGGCAKDLTKGKNPKEIYLASTQAMQEIKNYEMSMDMDLQLPENEEIPINSLSMTGTGKISVEPMMAEINLEMGLGEMKMPFTIYMVTENDKIIEYVSNPLGQGQWMKTELPLTDDFKKMMDPKENFKLVEESITAVEVAGEEKTDDVELVVLDVTMDLSKIMDTVKLQQEEQDPAAQEMINKAFSAFDELKYKAWVRKDNLYNTKVEFDMEQIFNKLAEADPEMQEGLKDLKGKMVMTYTATDEAVKIEIPEEVKKSAQDLSQMEEEMMEEGTVEN